MTYFSDNLITQRSINNYSSLDSIEFMYILAFMLRHPMVYK